MFDGLQLMLLNNARILAGEESLSGQDASGYAKAKKVIDRTFNGLKEKYEPQTEKKVTSKKNAAR